MEQVKRTQRRCWICGDPIDLALRFPHPMSFSVDHVDRIVDGGAEVDVRNLRAAHLRHNQQRKGSERPALRTSRKW